MIDHYLTVPCPYDGCSALLNVRATINAQPDRKGRVDITLTVGGFTDTAQSHLYSQHDDFDMFYVESHP